MFSTAGAILEYKDGFCPGEAAEKSLEKFYGLLTEYNKKVNLTSITEKKDFFIKHIWDSLAGQKYFHSHFPASILHSGALAKRAAEPP